MPDRPRLAVAECKRRHHPRQRNGWGLFTWTRDGETYRVDTGLASGAREPPSRMVAFQNGILSARGQPSNPADERAFFVDGVEYRPLCK